MMEKVWEELKKIEAQAQQIQTDAQEKAKKMTQQAKADAEKLVANSKVYAEEEAQKLYDQAVVEANAAHDAQLKTTQETAVKLKVQAQKNMDKAVNIVVDLVLED
jgi:vacuolar-type H+-ATPase subunit H